MRSPASRVFSPPAPHDAGQGVLGQGQPLGGEELPESEITAGDAGLLLPDELGIEAGLAEGPRDDHRLEPVGDDELRQRRVAADVPLGRTWSVSGSTSPSTYRR
jgi:hypothetical protein